METTQKSEQIYSFPPILPDDPKILILGTMPGRDSLKYQQYYAYRQNHFWPMIYQLMELDISPWVVDYKARTELLQVRGIALWDVFESCIRPGTSMDSMISRERPNDIVTLLKDYPGIRAIFFNGSRSAKGFKEMLKNYNGSGDLESINSLPKVQLPSSSPIPTKKCRNIDEKIEYWKIILEYLG